MTATWNRCRRAAGQGATALLAATLAFSTALPAQESPDSTFVERVDIRLVNVELWVTDRQGNFVSGLTADDFVLLHDGEAVPIQYFAEVGAERSVATGTDPAAAVEAGAPAVTDSSGGHLIVYFDDLNLHPGNRKILTEELEAFLTDEAVQPERLLILRQDRGLFVELPFGSDADEVAGALERIAAAGGEGASLATDPDQAMQEIRGIWRSSQDTAGSAATGLAGVPQGAPITTVPGAGDTSTPSGALSSGSSVGSFGPSSCEIFTSRVEPLLDGYYQQRAMQVRTTLERLSEAVTFLAGLDGAKTMLYLGDRLETAPAAGLATFAAGFCPTESRSLLMNAKTEDLSQLMTEVARHASANRVTIYGVQGSGLRSRPSGSASTPGQEFRGASGFEGAAQTSRQGGFLLLSDETGGRAVLNTNDFGSAFRSIQEESTTYYSLAYRPPPQASDRFHTIEVRTELEGLRTRHRRGYREKSADDRLTEKVLSALNLGLTENPLGIGLGAGTIQETEDGRFLLPLRVRVPLASVTFVDGDDGAQGELRLKVNAHDTGRGELVNTDRIFRLTKPSGQTQESVTVGVDLDLPEGVHVLAIGMRDNASGATSVVATTIELGDTGE